MADVTSPAAAPAAAAAAAIPDPIVLKGVSSLGNTQHFAIVWWVVHKVWCKPAQVQLCTRVFGKMKGDDRGLLSTAPNLCMIAGSGCACPRMHLQTNSVPPSLLLLAGMFTAQCVCTGPPSCRTSGKRHSHSPAFSSPQHRSQLCVYVTHRTSGSMLMHSLGGCMNNAFSHPAPLCRNG
jgi:hypothetical protein